MERLPFETGRVVQSLQGRDAGRCFVILQMVDDQFVLMADGLSRKLDHLKKKKVKHLHPKPLRMDVEALQRTNQLKDSDLRTFLRDNGLAIDQPLCKEG
ncbi:MAG: RNA-binding protein [Aristaeellaceae bacterium]